MKIIKNKSIYAKDMEKNCSKIEKNRGMLEFNNSIQFNIK